MSHRLHYITSRFGFTTRDRKRLRRQHRKAIPAWTAPPYSPEQAGTLAKLKRAARNG